MVKMGNISLNFDIMEIQKILKFILDYIYYFDEDDIMKNIEYLRKN